MDVFKPPCSPQENPLSIPMALIDTYAEPNPDKPEVHLPMGMKSDVQGMYMDEVNMDLHPVSSAWFNT